MGRHDGALYSNDLLIFDYMNLLNRTALFWDVNPVRIAEVLRDSDSWAIIRVFEYGEIEDIYDVIEFYGEGRVKSILGEGDLKPVAAVMAFLFLGVDRYNKYV